MTFLRLKYSDNQTHPPLVFAYQRGCWLVAIVVLATTMARIPQLHAAVIGKDERRLLTAQEKKTLGRALGVVVAPKEFPKIGAVTGTVIYQRDKVITAAHALFENGVLKVPLDHFVFGMFDLKGVPRSYKIRSYHTLTTDPKYASRLGFGGIVESEARNVERDQIILQLAKEVSFAIPLKLPSRAIDPTTVQNVRNLAFHADLNGGEVPYISPGRVIDKRAFVFPLFVHINGIVLSDVDNSGRSSGSCLIGELNGVTLPIATVMARSLPEERYQVLDGQHFNIFAQFSDELIAEIQKMRTPGLPIEVFEVEP